MGLYRFIQREFSFVRGNYLTLVISWILMDIGARVGYILTGAGMILGNLLYTLTPQLPFYLTKALFIPTILIIIFRIPEPKIEDRKY